MMYAVVSQQQLAGIPDCEYEGVSLVVKGEPIDCVKGLLEKLTVDQLHDICMNHLPRALRRVGLLAAAEQAKEYVRLRSQLPAAPEAGDMLADADDEPGEPTDLEEVVPLHRLEDDGGPAH